MGRDEDVCLAKKGVGNRSDNYLSFVESKDSVTKNKDWKGKFGISKRETNKMDRQERTTSEKGNL